MSKVISLFILLETVHHNQKPCKAQLEVEYLSVCTKMVLVFPATRSEAEQLETTEAHSQKETKKQKTKHTNKQKKQTPLKFIFVQQHLVCLLKILN